MEGTRTTSEELKARWAHSEIFAERWKAKYAQFQPEKVRANIPFADLSREEKQHLVWMCSRYREHMAPELDKFKEYVCESWTKDQLGRAYTIVRMAPDRQSNIPLLSFIACPRFDENSDPRVQADKIPFDAPFVQSEPLIMLDYGQPGRPFPILVEGYLRSVLFIRSPNPDARVLVWYPVIGP